jgi:hypothetical protein
MAARHPALLARYYRSISMPRAIASQGTEATRKCLSRVEYSMVLQARGCSRPHSRSCSPYAEIVPVPVVHRLVAPVSQCFVSGCHSPVAAAAPYHFCRRSTKVQRSCKQTTWRSRLCSEGGKVKSNARLFRFVESFENTQPQKVYRSLRDRFLLACCGYITWA